jgi:hypothetical protein
MQPGLHAFTWTITRLAIVLAVLAGLVVGAYLVLVAVVVVGQAAAGLAH